MAVISPKTEGHGQGHRVVPMFARLRPYLDEAWDMAQEGQTHVIPENLYLPAAHGPHGWVNCNLRTTFLKIVRRAGLEPWPRLFHVLRASCESDLAREYPITTACKWIGNTVAIAARHYVQVTDDDFRKASGMAKSVAQDLRNGVRESEASAAQNPAQQPSESGCMGSQAKRKTPAFTEKCEGVRKCATTHVEAAGIEPASRDVSVHASTCVVG